MLLNFLAAFALLLVMEGLFPFASPHKWRKYLSKIIKQNDKNLRIAGFISMMFGVILLSIIHQFLD